MISSRSKNALKVLIYLSEKNKEEYISLKEISDFNNISLKYLEQIMPKLTKAKFVDAKLGKSGGYRLLKNASDIKVWDIFFLYDEDVYVVNELKENDSKVNLGKTMKMWEEFFKKEKEYFSNISIKDLSEEEYVLDFVI